MVVMCTCRGVDGGHVCMAYRSPPKPCVWGGGGVRMINYVETSVLGEHSMKAVMVALRASATVV